MSNRISLTPSQRKQLYRAAYPIPRSPHGGMGVQGKDYRPGQFIPTRQTYAQDPVQEAPLADLNHEHLKSLDLHRAEPTWDTHGVDARNAYGGVIFNPQGHVLLVEPANHYYGYHWTFPKGAIDPGEHPVDTALREVKEESGHDAAILGVVPGRFSSPTGANYTYTKPSYSHYFVMRSHGQTSRPHWETASTRWASPDEAHTLIDHTTNVGGRERDHRILDAAVAHFQKLQDHPELNAQFQVGARRQTYARSSCDGRCACKKCSASQALDRVAYSRRERSRHQRVRRILYESGVRGNSGQGHYEGHWIPRWRDSVTPAEFIAARNNTKYPGFLTPLEENEIAHHQLVLSHDASVGAALSPEGDIQNVFNNGGPRGAGVEAILELMHRGGHTLDAFDHFLPILYSQLGFRETGRVKFNRDYAPPGWDYRRFGEPDVVFMTRPPEEPIDDATLRQQALDRGAWRPYLPTGRYFADWDEAKAHSRGGGIPQSPDPGPREGMGGTEQPPGPGERAGTRLPVIEPATRGHTRSLAGDSPIAALARDAHVRAAELARTRQTHADILKQARQKIKPIS